MKGSPSSPKAVPDPASSPGPLPSPPARGRTHRAPRNAGSRLPRAPSPPPPQPPPAETGGGAFPGMARLRGGAGRGARAGQGFGGGAMRGRGAGPAREWQGCRAGAGRGHGAERGRGAGRGVAGPPGPGPGLSVRGGVTGLPEGAGAGAGAPAEVAGGSGGLQHPLSGSPASEQEGAQGGKPGSCWTRVSRAGRGRLWVSGTPAPPPGSSDWPLIRGASTTPSPRPHSPSRSPDLTLGRGGQGLCVRARGLGPILHPRSSLAGISAFPSGQAL